MLCQPRADGVAAAQDDSYAKADVGASHWRGPVGHVEVEELQTV